jgi:S-adenosylmethionine:tRNA ribosyltransferase-isomerase
MPVDAEPASFQLQHYQYDLPEHLIAQTPSNQRDRSRLLILDRRNGELHHSRFNEIDKFLQQGDVLVINDTRVVRARFNGRKTSGGAVELLVLDPYKDAGQGMDEGYQCLIKSAKRLHKNSEVILPEGICAKIVSEPKEGRAKVRFLSSATLGEVMERIGTVPLPPYIHRNGTQPPIDDKETYQTVYASTPGAVAAPTAGLHFTHELLQELHQRGVEIVRVTLHVGYGTFAPLRTEDIREHRMHPEYAEISPSAAQKLKLAKQEKRRVIAVGTTVVRVLEWVAALLGEVAPFTGLCNHYIYPDYRFRVTDGMITNFHLPGTSLLLLVAAFAGRTRILRAYKQAIEHGYRFYSYGDATLIL